MRRRRVDLEHCEVLKRLKGVNVFSAEGKGGFLARATG